MRPYVGKAIGVMALVAALVGAAPASAADLALDVVWVDGMVLPDCDEVRLSLLLESLPGVEQVAVDFATGRTEITYDATAVDRTALLAELELAGFVVLGVTDVFVVGWEHARRDAPTVRLLLGTLEGVDEVVVDADTAQATVRYDPRLVSRLDLVDEMANLGWSMEVVPGASADRAS